MAPQTICLMAAGLGGAAVVAVAAGGAGAGAGAAAGGGCPSGTGLRDDGTCAARRPLAAESSLMQRTFATSEIRVAADPTPSTARAFDAGRHPDYDCDDDGVQDCGKWSYAMGMCHNQEMCGHFYRFPDQTLDQSCRCRRCPLTHDGSAFTDPKLRNPWEMNALSWGTFKNWADHMDTCAPWVMPRDDEALRGMLKYARDNKYKVRISGAGHSAGGIVTDGNDQQVMVISLAEYSAPGEWEFSTRDMPDGSMRATVNAGWTQFHLYEKVRPLDFFLPAQTAGYFFSLGGIVANSVHGGSYHAGFVHSYATRLRVMLHDGTTKVIDTEEEMRMWRCSFGLLGLILSIEFQLEKRPQLQMYTVQEKMKEWSSEEFWRFVKQGAEADLPDAIMPGEGGEGSKKAWNGEYFVDFINGGDTPEILVYSQKANSSVDADFDGNLGRPKHLAEHYSKLRNLRVAEDGRGHMSWSEAARRDGSPPIKIMGIDVNDILHGTKSLPFMASAMSKASSDGIARFVRSSSKKYNDGFFLTHSPAALAAAYFVEPSKAFASMDFLRKVQLESKGSKEFVWNLPGEFRFLNVQDSATLQPVPPGMWFNCQMISFADLAKHHQSWKRDFARVEEHWVKELGAKPHMGKLFGFGTKADGTTEPFQDSYTCTIYSEKQKAAFNEYRLAQDPEGLFATGLGMKFLQPCNVESLKQRTKHA